MERNRAARWTRRGFVRTWLVAPASVLLAACLGQRGGTGTPEAATAAQPGAAPRTQVPASSAPAQPTPLVTPTQAEVAQVLPPTPACGDDDDATPSQTAGPFFTPNSPERLSLLESGVAGTKLVVTGSVLSTSCQPVAGALLDFWQCDDNGEYDNVGYRLRGHQFADDQGRFSLETIVPGLYPGRTRHIHVRVQAPNQPVLTTQLYFPGEPANATDGIFHPELVMDVQDTADGQAAAFNFVLAVA